MPSRDQHLILAPHLDDAVLSCGGQIRQLADQGRSVLVVTLFAGRPITDLSPFAQQVHRSWGDPPDVLDMRTAEERMAMKVLGAEYRLLDAPEAMYRGPSGGGGWYYESREALFGEVHPDECYLPSQLAAVVDEMVPAGEVTIAAPLAVGHHVDHELTHAAARLLRHRGHEVVFYEDYPYAQRPGLLEKAREAHAAQHWSARLVALTAADLAAKITALKAYRSQVPGLFGREEYMADLVTFYAEQVGGGKPAERVWLP